MLRELKFVQGAVAAKDYVPELQHFKISGGRVSGYNGTIALSTPIDLDLEAMPKAGPFVKALTSLPEGYEVALNLTQSGRLSVKAGPFRAFVECWESSHPCIEFTPQGETYEIPPGILAVMRKLAPFMGIDASRPWACGILFDGQMANATNNVILIQHWMAGIDFKAPMNIPAVAIKEMLRIDRDPVAMQLEAGAITFHYDTGAWLRTALLQTDWPDLSAVLDRGGMCEPFPDGFFDGIDRLEAFTEKSGKVYLRPGLVTTSLAEGEGAAVEVPGLYADACFHLSQLRLLRDVATSIDLAAYPAPVLFFGEHLRGAVAGIRQ